MPDNGRRYSASALWTASRRHSERTLACLAMPRHEALDLDRSWYSLERCGTTLGGAASEREAIRREMPRAVTQSRSEPEVEPEVDLPHTADRGWLAEERRGQRAAVAEIVRFVRQVLRLHEKLQTVAGWPQVHAPNLRSRA